MTFAPRFLLTLALLALSSLSQADELRHIKSGAPVVSYQIGAEPRNDGWTLTPEAHPDVLDVKVVNGVPQTVRFITDVDTIELKVEADQHYDFVIDFNGKACLTRVVGKAYVPPTTLELQFDFSAAKAMAGMVATGQFDAKALDAIRDRPVTAAMIRKMHLKDFDAFVAHLKTFSANPAVREAAQAAASELARPDGKYASLQALTFKKLSAYVPADFAARIEVYFIFGSKSGGFAFGGDDVYVDLRVLKDASTEEIAEMISHEVFHAIQAHVMPKIARGAGANADQVWLRQSMAQLLEEGSAQLFTRQMMERPATPYSAHDRATIGRNANRIRSISALYETIAFRLHAMPPRDGAEYERLYGLMFYTDFDEMAYELGWTMIKAIEDKEGKAAVFKVMAEDPRKFILRYQDIARLDAKLPKFSDRFIELVKTL